MSDDQSVDWKFFKKPMSSPFAIMNRSAMPPLTKKLTLIQHGLRRLRNTRPCLVARMRSDLMEDLAEMMMVQG